MPEGTKIFCGDGSGLAYKRQGNRVVVARPRQSSDSCSCFVAYIQPNRKIFFKNAIAIGSISIS